ncbi:hypothetical protein [Arthrobacter sp. EPSL27]|uniref:hypothetical protein n=1 Tax=Arthrobacter sp. EPSL27 TaxID=1745378 RepID=UPI0012F8BD0D|nr:hypothetical protein [Arthrobacter sp. EPSL27]
MTKLAFQSVRYAAVFGATLSTFMCLTVASGAISTPIIEITVWISVFLLGVSFALTVGTMAYDHCHIALEELQTARANKSSEKVEKALTTMSGVS